MKARTKNLLLIEPVNFVHVQSTKTAKEIGDSSIKAFEDTGLTTNLWFWCTRIAAKLNNNEHVESNDSQLINAAHKLADVWMTVINWSERFY